MTGLAKVTLITGTSRGLGLALAEYFLERGHRVHGCSRRPAPISHPCYRHHEVDLSESAAISRLVEEVEKESGRIDHLINNAAVSRINHALLTPVASLRETLAVNTLAPFQLCQEVTRGMRRHGFGRVVNLSSVAVSQHLEGVIAYAASKAALEEITRILSKEVGSMGITVNCVGPSLVDAGLGTQVPAARAEALVQKQAIKRRATAADIAAVVEFFLSPTSSMVTGQVLYLGGP